MKLMITPVIAPARLDRETARREQGGSRSPCSRASRFDQATTSKGRIMSLSSCSTMWQWWT
jgi:hypothetical protein